MLPLSARISVRKWSRTTTPRRTLPCASLLDAQCELTERYLCSTRHSLRLQYLIRCFFVDAALFSGYACRRRAHCPARLNSTIPYYDETPIVSVMKCIKSLWRCGRSSIWYG